MQLKISSNGKTPVFIAIDAKKDELAVSIYLNGQVVFNSTLRDDFCKNIKRHMYRLPILTLFVLLSAILMNIFVIKKLWHLSNLFYFIMRNYLLTLILRCYILAVS